MDVMVELSYWAPLESTDVIKKEATECAAYMDNKISQKLILVFSDDFLHV